MMKELLRIGLDSGDVVDAKIDGDPVLVGDALGTFAMDADNVYTALCVAMVHVLASMAQDDADLLLDTVREEAMEVRRSVMNGNVNVG